MDSIMNKIKFNKEALNIIITEHVNKDQEDSIIELLKIDENLLKPKASESIDTDNFTIVKNDDILVIYSKKINKLYYLKSWNLYSHDQMSAILGCNIGANYENLLNIKPDTNEWNFLLLNRNIENILSLTELEIIDKHVHGRFVYL